MSLIENMIEQAFGKLAPAERMQLLENIIVKTLAQLSAEERREVLDHVVENFMTGLPPEEQAALVRDVLPALLGRLLQAGNMSVDDFIWAAMGSLGALEGGQKQPANAG